MKPKVNRSQITPIVLDKPHILTGWVQQVGRRKKDRRGRSVAPVTMHSGHAVRRNRTKLRALGELEAANSVYETPARVVMVIACGRRDQRAGIRLACGRS